MKWSLAVSLTALSRIVSVAAQLDATLVAMCSNGATVTGNTANQVAAGGVRLGGVILACDGPDCGTVGGVTSCEIQCGSTLVEGFLISLNPASSCSPTNRALDWIVGGSSCSDNCLESCSGSTTYADCRLDTPNPPQPTPPVPPTPNPPQPIPMPPTPALPQPTPASTSADPISRLRVVATGDNVAIGCGSYLTDLDDMPTAHQVSAEVVECAIQIDCIALEAERSILKAEAFHPVKCNTRTQAVSCDPSSCEDLLETRTEGGCCWESNTVTTEQPLYQGNRREDDAYSTLRLWCSGEVTGSLCGENDVVIGVIGGRSQLSVLSGCYEYYGYERALAAGTGSTEEIDAPKLVVSTAQTTSGSLVLRTVATVCALKIS